MSHIVVDKPDGLTKRGGVIFLLTALFLTLALAGCGGSGGGRYADYDEYNSRDADAAEEAAEEAADEAAEEARQEAYAAIGASSDGTGADASGVNAYDVEQPAFDNCTQDCSGHEAGFEWARENEIADESDCGGNSQSFYDGCVQFAEERQGQADADAQEEAQRSAEEAAEEATAEADQDDYESDEY